MKRGETINAISVQNCLREKSQRTQSATSSTYPYFRTLGVPLTTVICGVTRIFDPHEQIQEAKTKGLYRGITQHVFWKHNPK